MPIELLFYMKNAMKMVGHDLECHDIQFRVVEWNFIPRFCNRFSHRRKHHMRGLRRCRRTIAATSDGAQ